MVWVDRVPCFGQSLKTIGTSLSDSFGPASLRTNLDFKGSDYLIFERLMIND